MQFAIIATKNEMEEEKITELSLEEEKITELSLEFRCADEAVSFIRPRRGSSISWSALYAEATTAAYQTEISDMDAMSCRSERNESDDTIRPETPRKKHRLSKYQSTILEESFREQSTLTPKHKSALASKLNLEPRQVDVWFQNRRARTKWKRNEMECDNLKRCCENLREENRRLEKEVQSLRAMKVPQSPNSMPLAAATLAMCPSCEGIAIKNGGAATSSTGRWKSIPLYSSAFLGLAGQNED